MTDIVNNQLEVWDSAQHSEGRDSAHQISDKPVSYVFSTFNPNTSKNVRGSLKEVQVQHTEPTVTECAALTARALSSTPQGIDGAKLMKKNTKGKPSKEAKQMAKSISEHCPWLEPIASGKGFKEAYSILDLINLKRTNGDNSVLKLLNSWDKITHENVEVLKELLDLDRSYAINSRIYNETVSQMKGLGLDTLSLQRVQEMAALKPSKITATSLQKSIFAKLESPEYRDQSWAYFLQSGTGTGKTFATNISQVDDGMLIRTHPSHIVCQQVLQDSGPLTPTLFVSITDEKIGSITKYFLTLTGCWESLAKLKIKFEINATNGMLIGWVREENWPKGYKQWLEENEKHNIFSYYYYSLLELQSQKNTRKKKTVFSTMMRSVHTFPAVRSIGMDIVLSHAEKFCSLNPQFYSRGAIYIADDTGTENKIEKSHFKCLCRARKLIIMCGNSFDWQFISSIRTANNISGIVREGFSDALGEGSRLICNDTNELHQYSVDEIRNNVVASGTLRRDDIESSLYEYDPIALRNQIIDGSDLNKLRYDALQLHANGSINLNVTAAANLTSNSSSNDVKLFVFTDKESLWSSISGKFVPENLSKIMRSFEKHWSSYCSNLESYDKQTESMRTAAAKSSKTDNDGDSGKDAGAYIQRERDASRPVFQFEDFSYLNKLNIEKVNELSHLVDDRELYMLLRYGAVVLSVDSNPKWYCEYLSNCKTIFADADTIGTGINIPFLSEIHMKNRPGELSAEQVIQIIGRSGRPGQVPGLVYGNRSDFELAVDHSKIGLAFDKVFKSWVESEREKKRRRIIAARQRESIVKIQPIVRGYITRQRLKAERLEAERLEAERQQGHVHTRTQEGKAKRNKSKNAKQKQKREEMQQLVSTFQPTLMQDGNYWVTSPEGMWYQLFYDENQKPWFNRTSTNEIVKFPMKLSKG